MAPKVRKFRRNVKIDYPPVPTRKWVPPDQRPKKKRKPAYVKPPGVTQHLKISSLGKVWNNFRVLDDRTFLIGSLSETHKKFTAKSNGYQTPCNCSVALAFSSLIDVSRWSPSTIDQILEFGDHLYLTSLQHLEDRTKTTLRLCEVYSTFFFGDIKITMTMKGETYQGKLFEDYEDTPFLGNVIKDFFNDKYVSGIITTQKKIIAFWTSGKSYFLFDSTEHDSQAYPWRGVPGRGYAMVMRFHDTDELVDIVHENVDKSINSKFCITPCAIIRMVKMNTIPPENIKIRHCQDFDDEDSSPKKAPEVKKSKIIHEEVEEEEEMVIGVTDMEEAEMVFDKIDEVEEYCPAVDPSPLERRQVTPAMIPLEQRKAVSLTYFANVIEDKIGILRASTFQGDTRFSQFKGAQCFANAMAALTMLRVHKSHHWWRKILNDVLNLGEEIHKNTLAKLPPEQIIKVTTIAKTIVLENQMFTPDVEEFTTVGKLQSVNDDVLDLLPALKEFFLNNDTCIITGPLVLAVWKEDDFFYAFDPNERDQHGLAVMKRLKAGVGVTTRGVACVMWYRKIKDFVQVYMNNVEKPQRRDPFILSRVQINDYVTIPNPWCKFQGVKQGKWILRGTFNQNDRRFDKETRNTQSTAAAVLALLMSNMKHPKNWTVEDVDEVLLQGDILHKLAIDRLQESNKLVAKELRVDELPRKFPFESYMVNLDVTDCLVNGLLDGKPNNDALNLKKAMEVFFADNETGVVTTRSISVAIWKTDGVYYYYDSHSRDDQGVINNFGTACVLRTIDIAELTKAIEANLSPGASNVFNISRVAVNVWEMSADGIIRPPLNNYTKVNDDVAILRSLFNERDPVFKLNRGRQTIPMCLASSAMIKIYSPGMWTRTIVDEILQVGDQLYSDTMVQREKITELPEENDVDEVYAENCAMEFNIGLNKFNFSYGTPLEGNFEENFMETMATFLNEISDDEKDQKELLVTSDVYSVMTWVDQGVFYLFDPKPRDDGGQVYGKDEWSAKMEPQEDEGEDFYDQYVGVKIPDLGDAGDMPGGVIEHKRRSVGSQASEKDLGPKHSSHYWRCQEDEGGKACTMWFTTKDNLITHILENIPPTKRQDITFKLYPVTVINKPVIKTVFDPENTAEREDFYAGDWYEFKEIDYGKWILRGTMDLAHIMFPAHNRGRQLIGMCYSALAFVKRFALSKFKSLTVNDILKYGDRLHSATRNARYKHLKKNKELSLSEGDIEAILDKEIYGIHDIVRYFCIGLDQMHADVFPDFLEGDVNAQDFEDVLDVNRALSNFFAEHVSGILAAKNLTVAVWRGAKVFYMFDPGSRGPSGATCINGDACVTRFLNLGDLSGVFVNNLEKIGRNNFVIHRVEIKIAPCPRPPKPAEKERPEIRPKYNGYVVVMPGKTILHGTLSQDDPKFGRGKNIQCAPIAVVALTMTLIHKASIWTKPIIDEILIIGDELYVETLDTLGFAFNPWEQGMTVNLVNKDYRMGSLRANCELRTMDQRGVIDIKHPKILNLRQGIEKFFEENTHGIIETETLTVAIWEEEDQEDLIYMYDPNPRGPAGLPFNSGTACVLTFESPKLASEHFISNITDKTKLVGEFAIIPVEIVVGNKRTRRKEKKELLCCCMKDDTEFNKNPTPTQEEKKRLRKLAAEERARKEALRLSKLGKFEYHVFSSGDAILRGSKSQTWSGYCLSTRGNQDIPNCFAAFVVHRLVPVLNWHYKHIDLILDVGDQLYKDSYITYQPTDIKLGFANVLRKFFIKDVQVSLKVYKPVMENTLTASNLELALLNYFQQEPFGILSGNEQHVGLFFKEGYYYMFDPHDRDIDGNRCTAGCACVLRFSTLTGMISKYMDNVITMFDSVKNFTITLITIGSITKNLLQ